MRNDIIKKIMIMFCCLFLCFNLTTKKVKADSPSLSSNLKYWVVCVVLALAGGVKVGSDLTEAQLAKFKDKAVSYYKDLADNFGDRLSNMFTWSNALAVIAGTATSLVTGDVAKGGISMKWINNNIAELKKLADKWISDLTSDTTFNPVSSGSDFSYPEFNNYLGGDVISHFMVFSGFSIVNSVQAIYKDTKIEDDFYDCLFANGMSTQYVDDGKVSQYISDFSANAFSFKSLDYSKNYDEDIIKSMLLDHTAILKFTGFESGFSGKYLTFNIVNKNNDILASGSHLSPTESWSNSWVMFQSYFFFPVGVKVLLPDKTELKDIVLKETPKSLDNIKDYTDNLKNVDKLIYVKPDTLSIDKVGDKTIVSDPGVIGLPFPLPSDWTQPADKPYTGVDGKTHDPTKVLDPTKPWENDKTKPVSIPADPTIDLPYDDVKDRADPQVLDPDITTPKDDPKDIDVPDNTVNPTDSYKDWHKIFPFCIPWDIEALLSFLVAEPKAPSYTFDLGSTITSNKQAKNISFDLSQYDDQAKIIRNLEMILFAVGLLLLTRYIIKG